MLRFVGRQCSAQIGGDAVFGATGGDTVGEPVRSSALRGGRCNAPRVSMALTMASDSGALMASKAFAASVMAAYLSSRLCVCGVMPLDGGSWFPRGGPSSF